jgi:hypothetical protein
MSVLFVVFGVVLIGQGIGESRPIPDNSGKLRAHDQGAIGDTLTRVFERSVRRSVVPMDERVDARVAVYVVDARLGAAPATATLLPTSAHAATTVASQKRFLFMRTPDGHLLNPRWADSAPTLAPLEATAPHRVQPLVDTALRIKGLRRLGLISAASSLPSSRAQSTRVGRPEVPLLGTQLRQAQCRPPGVWCRSLDNFPQVNTISDSDTSEVRPGVTMTD